MAKFSANRGNQEALRRIAKGRRSKALELDLSELGLTTLPPEIVSLPALQTLSLRENQLTTLPPAIASLTALQTLDLADNRLTKLPPVIASLTTLKALSLRKNQLTTLPSMIASLTALQTLRLGGNQLTTLPPVIASLTALKTLDVSGNQLTMLPPVIASLTALETLDVSGNQLTTLPPVIASLTALQTLSLGGNQLTTLPPAIVALTTLQSLDVSANQLTTLPVVIASLTALKTLSLRENELTSLPPEFASLTALQWLYVAGNRLTTLPKEIGALTALQVLSLGQNRLTTLPSEIGSLTALEMLYLSRNQLTTLPPETGSLTALKTVWLEYNLLTTLPPEIGRLRQLEELDLTANRLISLPIELGRSDSLKRLFLHDNPALGLPNELLGPRWGGSGGAAEGKPPKQILQYYFDVVNSGVPLQECKLIVVGRGGAGKTTLIKRLKRQGFDLDEKETHGITITGLTFEGASGVVKARVWDFGGQVVLHSMHEFFMTARSLYLLVLGERDDMLERDAAYWLQLIRSYAGNAPVIIALNKSEGRERVFDRRTLETTYGPILGWVSTECSEPDDDKAGINNLRQTITVALDGPTMDSVRRKFPAGWAKIKDYLEEMQDSFLDYATYQNICKDKHEKDEERQRWLSRDLHDLGVALNYQNDPRLRETSVLRPDWLANGIYAVLRANDKDNDLPPELNRQLAVDGKVTLESLEQMYAKAERWKMLKAADYPLEKRQFLLRLMDTFHLSYPLDDEEDTHLVPTLLPVNPPEASDEPSGPNRMQLRYEFQVVPAPLIPWFIARTFSLIPGKLHWRRGAMLKYAESQGKIWTTQDERYVFVTVVGTPDDAKQLLSMVRGTLRELFESYKGLTVVEQHQYEGSWVPRATLEKMGVLKAEVENDSDAELGGER